MPEYPGELAKRREWFRQDGWIEEPLGRSVNAINELIQKLARYPELRFVSTAACVEIEAPTPEGFAVALEATAAEYVVRFEGWHEHFKSGRDALDCVAFAYSGRCRLATTYRGQMPVKWVLESFDDERWGADSEVGHFLVPFWLPARIVYRHNPNLLTVAQAILEHRDHDREPLETKTFWISFCDSTTGKNVGVCVVQVTSPQADEATAIHRQVNPHGKYPSDAWTVAAIGKSLLLGCNPGGEVAIQEVVDPSVLPKDLPRNRLIQEEELKRNGWD